MQGQNYSLSELEQLKDEELLAYFDIVDSDSIVGEQVARVYLDRARKKGDTIKMARGYDRLARIFHPEKNIMFADSLIDLTKRIKHKTYPALGYIIKSFEHYYRNDLVASSKNAIKAYGLAVENNNISQIIYISDRLIHDKAIWGDKNDALKLQISRHRLMSDPSFYENLKQSTREGFKGNIEEVYLYNKISSIRNFIFCYLNLRKLDSARIYLERGLTLNNQSNSSYKDSNLNWFDEVSIEIDYYSGNFRNVIIQSDVLLGKRNSVLSESSVFNLNIFKGLSSLQLNELRPGIRFLTLADSLYDLNNFSLQPYQRELFEQLLNYHKSNGNNDEQIKYLNKLIDTDSIFKINYQYFEPTIIKNFETPWLIREKEVLIKDLEAQNKTSQYIMYVSCVLLVFMLFFLVHLIYLKFRDKKRFLLLLAESTNRGGHFKKTSQKPKIGDEIIDELLKRLDQFERDEKFLSQSISLQKLAVTFKTNTKYLSNIINHEKDKSFPHYINDLRVDFALKEITENSKFRKYTIKAIAGDCGFNSAESFSKAFKKRHKVAASYFIKELEKLKKGP
tara:strand:+ start:2796 stop:4487 length:1692 start_codon:yes stop_codon:yes gene_type:complete